MTPRTNMPRTQRGVSLVVGLILLVLLTLLVTTSYSLSTTNLRAVGNMQFRDEATAAANAAIEQVLSSAFTTAPAAESVNVDIDNNGSTDYVVAIAVPTCLRASVASAAAPSSLSLSGMSSSTTWNTFWDIDATTTDPASGASVRVRQGVRVLLSQAQKDAVCP